MRILAIFSCVIAVLLAACSSSESIAIAEKQIPQFHEMLDASKFQEIYSQSSQDLKKAGTEKDFVALLEAIHRKLGTISSSEEQAYFVNFGTAGTFVTLTYKTQFAEGEASEKFVYHVTDNQALLAGYHVSSNALITK